MKKSQITKEIRKSLCENPQEIFYKIRETKFALVPFGRPLSPAYLLQKNPSDADVDVMIRKGLLGSRGGKWGKGKYIEGREGGKVFML